MKSLIALGLAVALLTACSGEADVVTTSSTQPTTTTSGQETTTSTSLTPTTTVTTTGVPEEAVPEGSGCTPGAGNLPDGNWYGLVADFSADGISFDLACWFSGDDAVVASAADGEESPPPNDYYVRNHNTLLRSLEVDASTPVTWYPSGAPDDVAEGTFADWTEHLAEEEIWFGIWVTITDGQVTEIEEMWVP